MSSIRSKTEMKEDEVKGIQLQDTLYEDVVLHKHMDTKLLLCILETLQDMKEELSNLRNTNKQLHEKLNSISDGNSVKVLNLN